MAALKQRKREVVANIGQFYVDANDVKSSAGTVYEEPLNKIKSIEEEVIIKNSRILIHLHFQGQSADYFKERCSEGEGSLL